MEADLRGLLELREAIAADVAAYAAQRATTGDLSALADCLKELERNEASRQFEELNRRFHDILGWASGNPLFEIGRASCRERVCQYVSISVVAEELKKKTTSEKDY